MDGKRVTGANDVVSSGSVRNRKLIPIRDREES